MFRRIVGLALFCLGAGRIFLSAQEFKIFDRTVQVHGFASQGFVYTTNNNWLTMNSTQGSAAFTDMGLNASTQVTDKFRIGAQVYDRNLGQLGQYHPSLDWAVADYRFKTWFGVRGGKVKNTLGIYTDTQDLDFLRTFALLPQSLYPTDLRDTTMAHLGADVYGKIALKHRLGDVSYTVYAGRRSDSIYSGYTYLLTQFAVYLHSLGGLQYGGDLRWNTPLNGLLIGGSRMNEDITAKGMFVNIFNPAAGLVPYQVSPTTDWANQFYGEYVFRKLHLDAEYRRSFHASPYIGNSSTTGSSNDIRGWYVSGDYRICKRLQVGSYYSRYSITSIFLGLLAELSPNQTDTSQPQNHIYDKVVTARVDLNRFWNVKIEGHFMDGYGSASYPDGFYPQVNPRGFQPNTNALFIKTSLNF